MSDISALDADNYVGLASIDAKHRLVFFDRAGNITAQKGGYYRTESMTFPEEINWHAFDGKLVVRDDGKRMAVANLVTDQIEIYDGQGELIRLVKGPDHFDPDVMKTSQGGFGVFGYGEKAREAHIFPLAKKNGFWSIYSGKAVYREQSNSSDKFKVILSFDWDGKPLDKYIIQADVVNFDVDESRGLIYGIIMTEEGEQKIIKAKYK